MVRNTRPALRRCRDESGYSLAVIIERCDTLMEASLQAGVSYQTVRRYARRWGIEQQRCIGNFSTSLAD